MFKICKEFKKKRGVTYVYDYSFVGYSMDGVTVYGQTVYSFDNFRGVIDDRHFTGIFVDEIGNHYDHVAGKVFALKAESGTINR